MLANQQLVFLQEKIQETRSAIFFNLSDSVLKFPTTIVNTLTVDDYGFVWFLIQKPKQNIKEFEAGFPVRLDYYRKGTNYFLQVMGKAWAVSDPEEMNMLETMLEEINGKPMDETVLVKVKMLRAEYHETPSATKQHWWQNAINVVYIWYRNWQGVYRPDNSYHLSS
jgi:hypothetical protein